jgi:hypothetical protein
MSLAARHQQAGAQELERSSMALGVPHQQSRSAKSRPRAVVHVVSVSARPKNRTLSIFLLDDGDDGTGMDETINPTRNARNRPRWPESPGIKAGTGSASSVPVCVTVRGIPAVPDGTGTESITMGEPRRCRPRLHLLQQRPRAEMASPHTLSTTARRS